MSTKPKIVVLGAGHAGLTTAKKLIQKLSPEQAEVVLVNKHNYHYEATWLHEVAAGTISPNDARVMISDVINPNKATLVYDTVVEIKKDEKRVVLENGDITYDYLVVALGWKSNDFGIKGMGENAFAIEDIDSSRLISEHIEYQFAKFNNEENADPDSLNILVGGAGFTGIEFVGELADKVPQLCRKYDIDRSKVKIINIEAAPSILPMFEQDLSTYAREALEERGVEIRMAAPIKECTPEGFIIGEEKELVKAGTIVWTGGVKGSPILEKSGFDMVKGKVNVNPDLRMPDEEDLFVIGDCSWVWDNEGDRPYAPTAQLAMQEADYVADNIIALMKKEPLKNFVFDNKGTVASLGHSDGIGSIFSGYKLTGKKAAAMKKVIDNRSLYLVGGAKLVLKKGKVRPF
ncbi:NADH dehydrogenase [Sinobaca qinghaiensis]|uniref:NADH dehydrogenase n=1 Tax=Sinobaca qinghaiensis TaxID=342944 RepID=A0A419UX88_9BACL|nr:NAD(P)/FAD-dependent oxidoreductase [Sinobaca qinghaiensis]RKD69731.1 NADH dehydrogenase [Sinobaca qinghaiensis]